MTKRALIYGIGGQDGSYLAQYLVSLGNYEVHGVHRRSSSDNLWRIAHIRDDLTALHEADLCDHASIRRIQSEVEPNEIYNLADQDNVRSSYRTPDYSINVTYRAVGNMLDHLARIKYEGKFFQPLSATIFGDLNRWPQNEDAPISPMSPYACAKAALIPLIDYYRVKYGLCITSAIMFNHDSPRRTGDYLMRCLNASARALKYEGRLLITLQNGDFLVDIGYSLEFMKGVHALMQLNKSVRVVMGTGKQYSIRQLAEMFARHYAGIFYIHDKEAVTTESPLIADCTHLKSLIDWDPKFHGQQLVDLLVKQDPQPCE